MRRCQSQRSPFSEAESFSGSKVLYFTSYTAEYYVVIFISMIREYKFLGMYFTKAQIFLLVLNPNRL